MVVCLVGRPLYSCPPQSRAKHQQWRPGPLGRCCAKTFSLISRLQGTLLYRAV